MSSKWKCPYCLEKRTEPTCPQCGASKAVSKLQWAPFVQANVFRDRSGGFNEKAAQTVGTKEEFLIFINNLYQVAVYDDGNFYHLSLKRRDRKPVTDWRHLQRIKNQIIGEENEGVELFPAESRLVDTSNQYHLFVAKDPNFRFPFGFDERWVCNVSEHGTVQRAFPEDAMPKDCMTSEQYLERFKQRKQQHQQQQKKGNNNEQR